MNVDELEILWNNSADQLNTWDELGLDEIVSFSIQETVKECVDIIKTFSKQDDDMGAIIANAILKKFKPDMLDKCSCQLCNSKGDLG